MKKFLFFLTSLILAISSFGQFGYKYKLEPVNGVEISYKIVHANFFDKSSPVQLRLKLKNTTDFDVNISFKIEYQFDLTKTFQSENLLIEIPRKSAKTGKFHGLIFEIDSDDPKVFDSDNADWEFIEFKVNKADKN